MTAADLFNDARAAVRRCDELCIMTRTPVAHQAAFAAAIRPNEPSNPTERDATYRVVEVPRIRTEAYELLDIIDRAQAVCDGVHVCFRAPLYKVLELYYLACYKWADVADELGISLSTCKRWRTAAFEWIDYVGIARAAAGYGRAAD